MSKKSSRLQRFAWFVFLLEIIFNIIMIYFSTFYPEDPTYKITNYSQLVFVIGVVLITIGIQIICFFAIKNMDSDGNKWKLVLLLMGFIHNPLYLIPSIGRLLNS